MENLTKLLEQLAVKLGTTTEYLWGVLIKQAAITGISNIIFYIITIFSVIGYVKFLLYISPKLDEWEYKKESLRMMSCIGIFIWTVINMIIIIVAFVSIEETISAFANPEYWALDNILGKLK